MTFDVRKQDSVTLDMNTTWPVRIQRDGTARVKAKGRDSLTTVKYAIEVR
jgi:vacuolar-type H+-ATPase catalytic subunit A/Vma1